MGQLHSQRRTRKQYERGKMKLFVSVIVSGMLLGIASQVECANILVLMSVVSQSHFIWYWRTSV